ncbi:MAG: N-(5-phosphoribosyl)anthranilate isomerase [Pseudomonadota bacterium]|jgi:phosphoribosylanthranilate isomerase
MNTRVKICGITRVQDGLDAVRFGAHAIGLVFYAPSPRAVTPDQARAIVDALPPFVTAVGLFVNADAEAVRATLATVPLQLLQFHGDETPEYCAALGVPYLKAIRVRPGVDLLQYAQQFHGARGLLLDAYVQGVRGGTGATFDWTLIPNSLPLPVVLSGGLDADNVGAAVRAVRPWAVDVSSGVESAKGIKDAAKIEAFMNGVRNAGV